METRSTWLLIPGHLCNARLWDDLRTGLAGAGARTTDADIASDDRIEAMARRALASLNGPVVTVGFSMGGMVALRMQALAPDRVAGMVLVDTNADADLPERSAARLLQQRRATSGDFDAVVQELLPDYLAPHNAARRDLLDPIMAMALDAGPETFVRQSEAIRLRPDARGLLRGIRCPVLVIAGRADVLCPPAWQRALAGELADGQLTLVDDAGHFLPLEAPHALGTAVLDWGARHAMLAGSAHAT